MRECTYLIDEPESTLSIIRTPLLGALRYYFDKNTVQFRTKGATLDWDKQIEETRAFIGDLDQNLILASEFCERVIRSSLLKHYAPPRANQSKVANDAQKVTFGPEEFYLGTPVLLKLQQNKVRIGKVRIECENLINN